MSVNKVLEILNQKERTLSFEFFPPKDDSKLDSFFKVVEDLISLSPDFISVTYGAGGSTRDKTMDISNELQKRFAIPKPVKNLELWQEYLKISKQHKITATWVKGHAGHPQNERCDFLARTEAERLKG